MDNMFTAEKRSQQVSSLSPVAGFFFFVRHTRRALGEERRCIGIRMAPQGFCTWGAWAIIVVSFFPQRSGCWRDQAEEAFSSLSTIILRAQPGGRLGLQDVALFGEQTMHVSHIHLIAVCCATCQWWVSPEAMYSSTGP